jgi:peptidoglycan/LPS O-acetylase OafA/YrhL
MPAFGIRGKREINLSTIGGHRQDIDGMRAVAVILVILYHLERSLAPGGFVGVDIFFVISGFVVTRSSFASPAKGPTQAVARFWRRRVLRILPPLLLTVLGSIVLIATLTPPFPTEAYNANIRTGMFSLFGLGNWYLYRGSSDYFRNDALTNSFVHTWSLGVEEQFYLFFAVFFIVLIGLLRVRRVQLSFSVAVMSALGVISYAAFLLEANVNPLLTYYSIPFRFWEIAVGGVLAYVELNFPNALRPRQQTLTTFVQVFALIALTKVIWFHGGLGFPSTQISVAVASSALLIATGNTSTPISRTLSSPLFVAIGLISYSLYLWHYPILLFWSTNFGMRGFANILLALLSILIAATFSYWTVERTFRYSKASFGKVLLPSLITMTMAVIGFAILIQVRPGIFYTGSKQLWNTEWRHPTTSAYFGTDRILFSLCDLRYGSIIPVTVPDKCFSSSVPSDSRPTVLVVGDSHAFADWDMVSYGASNDSYRFATLTHDGCAIGASNRIGSCQSYWANMSVLVGNTIRRNDSIFIAAYWPLKNKIETTNAVQMVAAIAQMADKVGAEVIVEAPLPSFNKSAFFCTKEWYRTNYEGCTVDRTAVEQQRANFMAKIQELVRAQRNVRTWDPLPILCPTTTCSQFQGESPLFRDDNHLSYYGARSLGPAFVTFWKHAAPDPHENLASLFGSSKFD